MTSLAAPYPATVQLGDHIIWDVNGERQAFVAIDTNAKVKLGKVFCSAEPLIGCPYGAMFGLAADGKSLERVEYVPLSDWDLPTPEQAPNFNTRTNAQLVESGANQALTAADIAAMKAEGAGGAQIVAALTENSATFAAKTEFSQEKYRKKKARKYIQIATVRRPTAAAVCEAFFANCPSRTSYLRADTLALLLSLANVGPHARVLVVEGCGGLVLAAAAERLGGHGGAVAAWPGGPGTKQPSLTVWRQMNLTPAQRAAMRFAPLHELLAERRQQQQQQQQGEGQPGAGQPSPTAPEAEQQPQPQHQQQQQGEGDGGSSPAAPMEVGESEGAASPAQQAPQQAQAEGEGSAAPAAGGSQAPGPASSQQLLRPPFNSCILAAPGASPLALIRAVLPLLAPSAALAVYSPWQQPLAEALDALRGQGQVAGLVLQDAWWREVQVLPLRSHPAMNMNHGGGFILTATALHGGTAAAH